MNHQVASSHENRDGKMLTDGVEASCSLCFEVMVVVAFGGTPFVQ